MTITYTYDSLYRLTAADYSNGTYFHYTYDEVGNRVSQTTETSTNTYQYDNANRLISVDGMAYTWDNNGNLLNDGGNTYSYDSANRLLSVTDGVSTTSYAYSGLGDRLRETVNGSTTDFTMDLNAGLTQVLSDGSYTYLYGNGRIVQFSVSDSAYFLTDAFGSVRQLVDANGNITLTENYAPYGEILGSTGSGLTDYGYTGEMQSQGLLDLRARWYNPTQGRFLSRDIWQGDLYKPISYNAWLYGYSNPIIYIDPTGHTIEPPYCPYGCLIWDYSNVGGSGFGGRLTRAVISTGTELIDFLLTNGATQTNPKACTWNLAGAEDRFVSGTIPPTLLGVIGGRQLPLPGFEQYLDDTTRQIHHIITNCSFAKVGE